MERERSGATLRPADAGRDYPIPRLQQEAASLRGIRQLQGAKCQAKFSISAISRIVSIKTIPSLPRPAPTPRVACPRPGLRVSPYSLFVNRRN
ncbi:hypothetical protein BaRGS_00004016 [Batillaria attramentaria]|uniref:Uncharacterized protein n=1 Tax=Batillaria attramentaria TaxID=370345 RepID=A0ABD0M0S1_9CAEN